MLFADFAIHDLRRRDNDLDALHRRTRGRGVAGGRGAEIRGAAGRLLAARGDVVGGRNECSEALAVFERLGPVYMVERTKRRITELDVTGQAQTA